MKLARRFGPGVCLTVLGFGVIAAAGCTPESHALIGPVPALKPVTVVVTTATGSPAAGLTVTAIRLDSIDAAAALTDVSGVAAFDLDDGRWCVSVRSGSPPGSRQVAGATGRVGGRPPGAPDTVRFLLQLASESVAFGSATLSGRTDHSGTVVAVVELPETFTTAAGGGWELHGLPPGVWTGFALHAGFQTSVFDLVIPAPADTLVRVDVTLSPAPAPNAASHLPHR